VQTISNESFFEFQINFILVQLEIIRVDDIFYLKGHLISYRKGFM